MGTILENHTLHIVNEDKTSEKLTGVMIQVNDIESVFHVRTAKKCSIPPVIKPVCDQTCPYWGYQCNINRMFEDCKKQK